MRMIFLLVVLLIIALVVTRQIGGPSAPDPTSASVQTNQPPKVPTRPQDVQKFGQDMDKFVQDSAARRQQKIEEQTR